MSCNIILVVPSFHKFDAIGADVLLQKQCLQKAGFSVFIYAELFDAALQSMVIGRDRFHELVADSANLIIYHFGVYWQGLNELIETSQARIWIKYHNITPPHFYAGWDEGSFHATAAGQAQARWIATHSKVELFIGDSQYNLDELAELSGHRPKQTTVLAPMVNLLVDETFDREGSCLLEPDTVHVLFVGRVVPNKAHKHLLGVLRSYRDFFPDDGIKLHIAGDQHQNFTSYYNFLSELAVKSGIRDQVVFWGKAPAPTLKALYLNASVFLCMSEHEGFCVPLIEAQQAGLPVIALARAAVPDTLGQNQLLVSGAVDYDHTAYLIHEVAFNPELRKYIIKQGQLNASRFSTQNLENHLLQLIYNQI